MQHHIERRICDPLRVELEADAAVMAEVGTFVFARGAVEWDMMVQTFGHAPTPATRTTEAR